ncbi:putative fructokinase [Bradyrhizobium sp. ORS 285]|uniref:carbohydrate kinase family protein n=1 Tax=Bradyrhizobium sp. ORS 285 TaxID=115808 RepID=UPI000240A640|nr:carbohydrate kinase [Bradyrhizobium sp. ORS 285]CCD88243.1 putative fructokinase [Bradyrhizobium sp. ORS 285]SMX61347.1 putative fructokinase [Bradyrhizobium sp. ORS 285]
MILSCGDALIDFVPAKLADGRDVLRPVVGGSCLNVAVGLARLGAPTGFVGGISTDLFGTMIAAHAQGSDVDLRYASRSSDQTTLAFVRHVGNEAQYAFYDAETAARNWTFRPGSIAFADIDAIHVGSTTLIHDQGARETRALIDATQGAVTISFDPNCRPNLVADKAAYVVGMDEFAARADLIKMSDVDFDYLHSHDDYATRAAALLAGGTSLVVITRGPKGALGWHAQAGAVEVAVPKVNVVDTIGAGDTFQAGMLFALRKLGRISREALKGLGEAELRKVLAFAGACAAVTCTREGADPPRWSEMAATWDRLG